jgi:hypothetical protein
VTQERPYDLDALRAAVEKATPGDWQHHLSHVYGPDPERALICQFHNAPWLVSDRDAIVTLINAARAGLIDDAALGRAVQDEERVARLIFEHTVHVYKPDNARYTYDEFLALGSEVSEKGAIAWCRAAARALVAMGGQDGRA